MEKNKTKSFSALYPLCRRRRRHRLIISSEPEYSIPLYTLRCALCVV